MSLPNSQDMLDAAMAHEAAMDIRSGEALTSSEVLLAHAVSAAVVKDRDFAIAVGRAMREAGISRRIPQR